MKLGWLDLFGGCGGVAAGLHAARHDVLASVEHITYIADCYRENHPDVRMFTSDIRDVDLRLLPSGINAIWASPVCKQDSQARIGIQDRREDASIGMAIIPYIEHIQPELFILENVSRYQNNSAFREIMRILLKNRYTIEVHVINTCNYGIPQYRERLILQARKGPVAWPDKQPLCSWDRSLSDLFPTMKEGALASWQKQLWKAEYDDISVLVAGHYKFRRTRETRELYVVPQGAVSPCVTASGNCLSRRVVLSSHQVLHISQRENARLQTFPDNYWFPEIRHQAQVVIGNAVPPLLVQALVESYEKRDIDVFGEMQ